MLLHEGIKVTENEIQYRGYTIVEDYQRDPYRKEPYFMYYPTEQGVQHDADFDGDGFKYCGNCKWEDSLDAAIGEIDIFLEEQHNAPLKQSLK